MSSRSRTYCCSVTRISSMTYSQKSTLPLADVGVLAADDKDSSGLGEGERALKPRLYLYVTS